MTVNPAQPEGSSAPDPIDPGQPTVASPAQASPDPSVGQAEPVPSSSAGTVVSRRPRGRLARLTGRNVTAYSPILEPLIRTLKVRQPKEDLDLIIRAYEVAEACHSGQRRKSGDPYITHPVAVATILAELGLSGNTLAAALLHDTVEDTSYSLDQLRKDFGEETAHLVDGVTTVSYTHLTLPTKA